MTGSLPQSYRPHTQLKVNKLIPSSTKALSVFDTSRVRPYLYLMTQPIHKHPATTSAATGILIRPAPTADLPALLEFEQGVIAAERPMDPPIKEGPINYYN